MRRPRLHRRRSLLFALLALALLAVPAAASAACKYADTLPRHGSDLAHARSAVLCLVNHERTSRHQKALHSNSTLRAVGTELARDMVKRHYFDHTTPGGRTFSDRLQDHDWSGRSAGENIAWGSGRLGTPANIVDAWMHSPGHRKNILTKSFRRAGVGIAIGAPERGVGAAATYSMDYDRP